MAGRVPVAHVSPALSLLATLGCARTLGYRPRLHARRRSRMNPCQRRPSALAPVHLSQNLETHQRLLVAAGVSPILGALEAALPSFRRSCTDDSATRSRYAASTRASPHPL